jgi:hypothetical protein
VFNAPISVPKMFEPDQAASRQSNGHESWCVRREHDFSERLANRRRKVTRKNRRELRHDEADHLLLAANETQQRSKEQQEREE